MAPKLNINLQKLPMPAKILIAVGSPLMIIVLSYFIVFKPKFKEIDRLEAEIIIQQKEIAKNEAKAANLPELKKKYTELEYNLKVLSAQLPEEKEISNLLKQVSDMGTTSGLTITLWKPGARKTHSSGIVYEIPVNIKITGSFDNLGTFFSRLTGMSRIINITDIAIKHASSKDSLNKLDIAFVAQTFSAIPEGEKTGAVQKGAKTGVGQKGARK